MLTKEKFTLKKFIRELEAVKGRHTELVSVYVPAGYDLNKIIGHLRQEQGTATNIKDARTRKNVIDSLERAIRHLRLYKRTPENGIAIFAGNAAEKLGDVDIKVWCIEPPQPLNIRLYRCDQTFVLDLLKDMMETKEVHGLIVMDKREATVGLLRGKLITVMAKMTSGVPGKTRAGGQSSLRFERLRENAANEFYKRIAEIANKEYLAMGKNLKSIIIGGPGRTKNEFTDADYLNNELKKKVIGLKDITYTDEAGLHELVERSSDILAQEEITKEKKIMQRLFEMLAKEPNKVAYGKAEVEKNLQLGIVDILLISESIDETWAEQLEKEAEKTSTKIEIISIDTKEGSQLKDLGGVAAILRYAV